MPREYENLEPEMPRYFRLDAITDAEREAYHAGYAAYRCE